MPAITYSHANILGIATFYISSYYTIWTSASQFADCGTLVKMDRDQVHYHL